MFPLYPITIILKNSKSCLSDRIRIETKGGEYRAFEFLSKGDDLFSLVLNCYGHIHQLMGLERGIEKGKKKKISEFKALFNIPEETI